MSFFERPDWQKWLPGCGCEAQDPLARFVVVQFAISGNEKRYGLRCQTCGRVNGGKPIAVSALALPEREEAAKHLLNLAQSREALEAAWALKKEQPDTRTVSWWKTYDEYLSGKDWQEKRQKVLTRDRYVCQACLERRAVQVHHLTYRHVFAEPLFDLVAVCVTCHELITAIERRTIPRESSGLVPPAISGD